MSCLNDSQLQAYHAAQLPEDQRHRISRHLQGCERCRRRSDELLSAQDELLAQLQDLSTAEVEDEESSREHNRLLDRLRGSGGADPDAHELGAAVAASSPIAAKPRPRPDRVGPYKILERIGEGGMGTVYLAEQSEPIRRRVALKIIKLGMDTRAVVARFEAERQALAMMDHPNVAKVLDAGATEQGRPYFVMEHVQGESITDYCDRHRLTTQQRLDVFMQVCHAVQHAHQKAIIHRDLKPSNILVGVKDGKPIPKVIDFGVAKATEQKLTEKTLFTEQGQLMGTPEYMSPEQAEMSALNVDTRADIYSLGVVLYELLAGVLPFDSKYLRQAAFNEIQRIIREEEPPKPSTRLSSLDAADSSNAASKRRTDRPGLERQLRGDLDWITLKAMDKDRTRRYATPSDLAEDLQRHLDHEPVAASPPSAGYRASKFLRRNRGSVAAVAAVVLALAIGLVFALRARASESSQRQVAQDLALREQVARRTAEDLSVAERESREEAEDQRRLADAARAESDARYHEIVRLSDIKRLANAEAAAEALWPAHPENIEAMEAWLREQARPLRERLELHRTNLSSLRGQALSYDDDQRQRDRETHPQAAELAEKKENLLELREQLEEAEGEGGEDANSRVKKIEDLQEKIAVTQDRIVALEEVVKERRTWKFTNDELEWRHDTLAELVHELEGFAGPDPTMGALASVEERLKFAQTIKDRSVAGPQAAWTEARADIAGLDVYGGLDLKPQLGLVPLRRDPRSGLWEFWHVQTGERPLPNVDPGPDDVNSWRLTGDTGLVFVLIPGVTFWIGAQPDDPDGATYDPGASINEGPVHEVVLDPFFISKYEMTQGQWQRFTGSNPSNWGPTWFWEGRPRSDGTIHQNTPWNPVEQVSWDDCQQAMQRLGLVLPTEAQWECAARAATDTPWWSGADKESIGAAQAGNLADGWTKSKGGPRTWQYEDWLQDGWALHAPVGSFSPNPFGLHDTIGNVHEWCRDRYGRYDESVADGSGERRVSGDRSRVTRGGCFSSPAVTARSAYRNWFKRESRRPVIGVRPARVIER